MDTKSTGEKSTPRVQFGNKEPITELKFHRNLINIVFYIQIYILNVLNTFPKNAPKA